MNKVVASKEMTRHSALLYDYSTWRREQPGRSQLSEQPQWAAMHDQVILSDVTGTMRTQERSPLTATIICCL